MSDESVQLLLREGVSFLSILSNLGRQVATFRKTVTMEKVGKGGGEGGKREKRGGGKRRGEEEGRERRRGGGKGGGKGGDGVECSGWVTTPT